MHRLGALDINAVLTADFVDRNSSPGPDMQGSHRIIPNRASAPSRSAGAARGSPEHGEGNIDGYFVRTSGSRPPASPRRCLSVSVDLDFQWKRGPLPRFALVSDSVSTVFLTARGGLIHAA